MLNKMASRTNQIARIRAGIVALLEKQPNFLVMTKKCTPFPTLPRVLIQKPEQVLAYRVSYSEGAVSLNQP